MTCMHPDVGSLETVWTMPDPHPCTRAYAEVMRDFDAVRRADHERDLWNVAGRHRKCNSYCLRKGKCRFHFGDDDYKPLTKTTKVVYDVKYQKDSDGNDDKAKPTSVRIRIVHRRNDKCTVDINEIMFYGNGFNSVYKVVVDGLAAKNYASKYSSKAPKQSAQYKGALQNILKHAKIDTTSKTCVIKAILKSHGEIDRSPAEWCHFINSNRTCATKCRYPDGSIGKYVNVTVSLKGGKRINMDAQNEEDVRSADDIVTMDSILDAYARRKSERGWCTEYPEIKACNLLQFATDFAFFAEKNMIRKRTTKVFVSFYPRGVDNYKVCLCNSVDCYQCNCFVALMHTQHTHTHNTHQL